jgi:hypothetical protein
MIVASARLIPSSSDEVQAHVNWPQEEFKSGLAVSGCRLLLQQRDQSPADFILLRRRGYLEKRCLEIRMCDAALDEAVSFGP